MRHPGDPARARPAASGRQRVHGNQRPARGRAPTDQLGRRLLRCHLFHPATPTRPSRAAPPARGSGAHRQARGMATQGAPASAVPSAASGGGARTPSAGGSGEVGKWGGGEVGRWGGGREGCVPAAPALAFSLRLQTAAARSFLLYHAETPCVASCGFQGPGGPCLSPVSSSRQH